MSFRVRVPVGSPVDGPRVALIGDIGGHHDVFVAALTAAGVDVAARRVPGDLTVVQVGDLVHKGPADAACVQLADDLLRAAPGAYVQLWGNHDAAYVGGPDVSGRPGVTAIDDGSAATLRRWYAAGTARLAVAIDTVERGPVLVTHGGLTAGLWRRLGRPATAVAAAEAVNGLLSDPQLAFRPGRLMTGVVDLAAGVTCPRTGAELAASWLAEGVLPFDQVHGHEAVWDWPAGRWHDDVPAAVRELSTVEPDRRSCSVEIAGRRLLSVDWVLGAVAPERCGELFLAAGTVAH